MLRQQQLPVILQPKKLLEGITDDRIALISWPAVALLIPSDSSIAVRIQNTDLKETPFILQEFLSHYDNDDGQLEIILG